MQVSRQPAPRRTAQEDLNDALDVLSDWLDSRFAIPGTSWRIGVDSILGLIPGVGDVLSVALSFFILAAGLHYGVPRITLVRMGINVALDFVVGSIPIVGDAFDVWFKSNRRNVAMIQRARMGGSAARRGVAVDWLFVAAICAVLAAILIGATALVWMVLGALFRLVTGG